MYVGWREMREMQRAEETKDAKFDVTKRRRRETSLLHQLTLLGRRLMRLFFSER